jgi:hypothetical protein
MKFFLRMTVGKRLTFGFAMVLVLLVAVVTRRSRCF